MRVITPRTEREFWTGWDRFVRTFGTNPFYLGGFVDHYMKASHSGGSTPYLIVMNVDGRLVGGAALKSKGVLGARTAELLLPKVYGTDFVVDPQYREAFTRNTLRLLLVKLRCQLVDLTFPSESPNLSLLKEACRSMRIQFEDAQLRSDLREHSVIYVKGTWDEFRKSRSPKFRKRYRVIERMLGETGRWKTERMALDGPEAVKKVNIVESNSWKNAWRRERGIESDPNLPALFAYWKLKSPEEEWVPGLCLLELNGEPIAYTITLQLNGVGIVCKTSFDQRYARMSPGEYIQNVAIQDLFESGEVSKIDFLTALPYVSRWTSLRETRARVIISRSVPVLSPFVRTLEKSKYIRSTYKALRHPGPTSKRAISRLVGVS